MLIILAGCRFRGTRARSRRGYSHTHTLTFDFIETWYLDQVCVLFAICWIYCLYDCVSYEICSLLLISVHLLLEALPETFRTDLWGILFPSRRDSSCATMWYKFRTRQCLESSYRYVTLSWITSSRASASGVWRQGCYAHLKRHTKLTTDCGNRRRAPIRLRRLCCVLQRVFK